MATETQVEAAKEIVAYYTLAASATGALPVPAASVAIVAQNGTMVAHIASALGAKTSIATVVDCIGLAGTINMVGRTLFIEGARLFSWGTGNPGALAAVSLLGAGTAGLQTYIVGRMAIEIGKHGGSAPSLTVTADLIKECKSTYKSFVAEYKDKKPRKPK